MFGKLGNASLVAATNTTVYTVPAAVLGAEIDIDIVNTSGAAGTVDGAFSTTANPVASEFVEKTATVSANSGHLLRTGDKLSAGEQVVIKASATGVVVRISGKEIV